MPLPISDDSVKGLQEIDTILGNDELSDSTAVMCALRKALRLVVQEMLAEVTPQPAPPPVVTDG